MHTVVAIVRFIVAIPAFGFFVTLFSRWRDEMGYSREALDAKRRSQTLYREWDKSRRKPGQ